MVEEDMPEQRERIVMQNYWLFFPQHVPPAGTWCWVSDGEREWVTKWDGYVWTNVEDRKDFEDCNVRLWLPIPEPPSPRKQGR